MSASQPLLADHVYLSREGKVFGPYTQEDLTRFRQEGELAQYAWLWDGVSGKWMPIHSEPPRPKEPKREQTSSHGPRAYGNVHERIIHAICYDSHRLVGGTIESIDEKGAIVACSSDFQDLSPFHKGQKLVVNLVDEFSGKSENVEAYVVECTRQGRSLLYRFLWYVAPEIIDRRRVKRA